MCNGKEALTCLLCTYKLRQAQYILTFEKSLAEELTNELLFFANVPHQATFKYVHRSLMVVYTIYVRDIGYFSQYLRLHCSQ